VAYPLDPYLKKQVHLQTQDENGVRVRKVRGGDTCAGAKNKGTWGKGGMESWEDHTISKQQVHIALVRSAEKVKDH